MKLVKVQVENFRSVENSEPFKIDDLTCLVGKNEAGKTAILQALHALFPYNAAKTSFDITEEYPRRFVTRYKERHPKEDAVVVRTWWELCEDAREALMEEFGEKSLTGGEVEIYKRYNQKGTTWILPLDASEAIRFIVERHKLNATDKKPVSSATSATAAISALKALEQRTERQEELLKYLNSLRDQSITCKGIDLIDKYVPKFFYVSHWDRMSGKISIKKLAEDKQQNKPTSTDDKIFLDFLQLAGTSLEELRDARRFEELNAKCEAASNDITQQIFTYWTQNDALEVQVTISEGKPDDEAPFNAGTVVQARVWNTLHRASVPFSERSAGFVWFFSFLVQFTAMRRDAGNVIILLDEPGLTLHGKAQADLLRYMETELLPHHQVVYSTHSPFMVPTEKLLSVRIVEDVIDRTKGGRPEVKGTKVREDVLATDRDTLFPLQGALGYDLTQSLFVGKNTLLVEGPSDILYLQALSNALKQRKRTGLDPRWTMCPTGGIGNVRSFVSLFAGNHLDVAVLADQAKGDLKKLEDLRRSDILKTGRIYTAADFTGKAEADIEDLFEPELFVKIVNAAYELPAAQALTVESLAKADEVTERQVKKAEAAFNVMPEEIPTYDHFTPAAWLIRNAEVLSKETGATKATLHRAEKLFETINALLEKPS